MILRIVAGFAIGILTVLALTGNFSTRVHDNQTRAHPDPQATGASNVTVRKAQTEATDEVEQTSDIPPEPAPPQLQTDSPAMTQTFEEAVPQTGFESEETDIPPTSAAESIQGSSDITSQEKFYFWQPFSAGSRAERFAAHISAASQVTCHVEHSGPGRYQVYFQYAGEADKKKKTALLRGAGVVVQP